MAAAAAAAAVDDDTEEVVGVGFVVDTIAETATSKESMPAVHRPQSTHTAVGTVDTTVAVVVDVDVDDLVVVISAVEVDTTVVGVAVGVAGAVLGAAVGMKEMVVDGIGHEHR